ncbi:MAG: biopolymer transporter ExbD [Planctomycetota bacterium]|nr:biopolymer transporter ExbD [Planctomycetota bacterium]
MSVKRRAHLDPSVPTASMGDIAFLLIIFFILTTSFAKERQVKLKDPVSRDIYAMKEPPVFVSVDKNGVVWCQGRQCSAENLEDNVKSAVASRPEKLVKLRVDRAVRQEQYGPVFLALSRAGVEIALVGQQAREKD